MDPEILMFPVFRPPVCPVTARMAHLHDRVRFFTTRTIQVQDRRASFRVCGDIIMTLRNTVPALPDNPAV